MDKNRTTTFLHVTGRKTEIENLVLPLFGYDNSGRNAHSCYRNGDKTKHSYIDIFLHRNVLAAQEEEEHE